MDLKFLKCMTAILISLGLAACAEGNSESAAISSSSPVSSETSSADPVSSFSSEPLVYKTLSLTPSTTARIPNTSTNYGTFMSSFQFEYYRVARSGTQEMMHLIPFEGTPSDGTIGGAFYNIERIPMMRSFTLTYAYTFNEGERARPVISFGTGRTDMNERYELEESAESKTVQWDLDGANYFEIVSDEATFSIRSIEIEYAESITHDTTIQQGSGDGLYRINPTRCQDDELVSGVSRVTMPVGVSYNGDTCSATSVTTYVYYDYSYVSAHPEVAEEASYTDPVDVANYFIAFGTYPANYVLKASYRTAYTIFGEDTRCVSHYSRTDGYARSVPYASVGGSPSYYECDIALSAAYSSSNRGVGRLVVWEYGFDETKGAEHYDSAPVAVYTDDHYYTFQEYLNTGLFSPRFNAEGSRTSCSWSAPTTIALV